MVDTLVTAAGTWPRGFVVRRDHDVGTVDPISLEVEYGIYRRLGSTAVPVTKALWFEDDPAWAPDGRPAYVRTRVEGHWRLPFLSSTGPDDDDRRIAASKEHLDKLALVHQVDWKAAELDELFPVPDGPADVAHNLIRWFCDRLAAVQFEPSPVLAEGLHWLRSSRPPAPCVTFCKGTNGHGEEVWQDGRIVAMSDWELACIAEPAYDIAQIQEMVPTIERDGRRLWGLDEALAYYRDRTGIEVTPERRRVLPALLRLADVPVHAQRGAPGPPQRQPPRPLRLDGDRDALPGRAAVRRTRRLPTASDERGDVPRRRRPPRLCHRHLRAVHRAAHRRRVRREPEPHGDRAPPVGAGARRPEGEALADDNDELADLLADLRPHLPRDVVALVDAALASPLEGYPTVARLQRKAAGLRRALAAAIESLPDPDHPGRVAARSYLTNHLRRQEPWLVQAFVGPRRLRRGAHRGLPPVRDREDERVSSGTTVSWSSNRCSHRPGWTSSSSA